jgi:hypothetical protein
MVITVKFTSLRLHFLTTANNYFLSFYEQDIGGKMTKSLNHKRTKIVMNQAHKAVSYVILFKSVVGFSVTALALFGISVPYLSSYGIEPNIAAEGAAAGFGALLGAIVALRA